MHYVRRGHSFRFNKYAAPGPEAIKLAKQYPPVFPSKPELPDIPIGDAPVYDCDCVVACCARDVKYLTAAVTSLVTQRFVNVRVHVVFDGFKPSLIVRREFQHWPNVVLYWHQANIGPYLSTMRVVQYMQTPYLAIQDADDVSMPYRLWHSCQILEQTKAALVGGACVQSLAPGEHVPAVRLAATHETYRFSGQVWDTAPLGMSLHPATTFSLKAFRAINGYGDYMSAGDCEINTRLRAAGYKAIDAPTLYTVRQLRSESLSHGFEKARTTGYWEWVQSELASRYSEFAELKNVRMFEPAAYGVLERETASKDTMRFL